jgi:hypothetical protein
MGIIRSKKYFKELRSHHASPQVLGLILPYHKRDLDSDLNEQAKSQSNSGKIRVKSLLSSILKVSRLDALHSRGPAMSTRRSNAHGEPQ